MCKNFFKITVQSVIGRDLKFRKDILRFTQLECALLSDLQRIGESFRHVIKESLHLLFALEVELIAAVAEAILIVNRLPGLDTQQNIVREGVPLRQIMAVVGGHQGDAHLLPELQDALVQLVLKGEVLVALDLQVELWESVQVVAGQLVGLGLVTVDD